MHEPLLTSRPASPHALLTAETLVARQALGIILLDQRKFASAASVLGDMSQKLAALPPSSSSGGGGAGNALHVKRLLAQAEEGCGRRQAAVECLREAVEMARNSRGFAAPLTLDTAERLASLLAKDKARTARQKACSRRSEAARRRALFSPSAQKVPPPPQGGSRRPNMPCILGLAAH